MGDADRMVHYGVVSIDILLDIYAPHELHELTGLRALVRALGIDRLANQMDRHGIISHFRCAIIPLMDVMGKNYLSSHMRDNSKGHCGARRWAAAIGALLGPSCRNHGTQPSL